MERAPWTPITIPDAPVVYNLNSDIPRYFSLEMSLAHNLIIRGIISIWTHAPVVIPADEKAFSGYALTCLKFIHTHHDSEEEIVFPRLQAKLDMGHNIEQHDAFQGDMVVFEEYITRVYDGEEKYDGERARKLLTAFADPLIAHLKEEIATITQDKLSVFTNEELTELCKALEQHIKEAGGLLTIFPYALTGNSKADAPEWPPVPAPIKWFARNIGYFFYRSYWKFAPYTRTGEPQEYAP